VPALLELAAVALIVLIGVAVARAAQGRMLAKARWEVVERTDPDGTLRILLTRAGQHPREVRALPPGLPTDGLDEQLAEARAEAASQRATLNAGLRRR